MTTIDAAFSRLRGEGDDLALVHAELRRLRAELDALKPLAKAAVAYADAETGLEMGRSSDDLSRAARDYAYARLQA